MTFMKHYLFYINVYAGASQNFANWRYGKNDAM